MRFLQATRRIFAEPHPHARNPVSMAPHRLDTAQHIRMAIKAGATFVPTMAVLFGWPLAARAVLLKTGI